MFSRTILATVALSATGNMERADVAAALDKRDDGALVAGPLAALDRAAAWRVLRRLRSDVAEVGFVGFHDLAFAAQRAQAPSAHRLADAVRHEPSGLVTDVQRAVELVGGNALLAGAHQMEGLQPLVQGDLARSMTVLIVTVKSLRQPFSAQRNTPGRLVV